MDESQISDIRNAVLEKCKSIGNVLHIYVDKRSTHVSILYSTCIYILYSTCIYNNNKVYSHS